MIVRGIVSPKVEQLRELSWALKKGFEDFSWNQFGARSIHFYNDAFTLRFVISCQEKKYTTGLVYVGGNHYEELARRSKNRMRYPLKDCNIKLNLSDLEKPISAEERDESNSRRNWGDDKEVFEELLLILSRLAEIERLSYDEFAKLRINQDAALYNLTVLTRTINKVSFGYQNLECLRREIGKTIFPHNKPWLTHSDDIWNVLKTIQKVRWCVNSIVHRNREKFE